MTIRKEIIANIVTSLADIRTANGYVTEIGTNVFKVRKNLSSSKLPAITVWPQSEDNEKIHGKNRSTMPIRIEGILAFTQGDDLSDLAEDILGDIRKRMEDLSDDVTSGLADRIEYQSGGVDEYPEPGDAAVVCSAVFNIVYKTVAGDPFSQS